MARNKLVVWINKKLISRKVVTFTFCLIVSSLLWLINALNRNYTRVLYIPIKYENLPYTKSKSNHLPSFISAEVKTSGAKLLFLQYLSDLPQLVINMDEYKNKSKKRGRYVIPVYAAFGTLSKHLNVEVEPISIKPDTIYYSIAKQSEKRITVKADLQLNFEPLYVLSDKITLTPSSVTLFGDSSDLKQIDSIYTEKIVLNALDHTIDQKVNVLIPEALVEKVSINPKEVNLHLVVDKITESVYEIPIKAINVPIGMVLKTFPDKAKVRVHYQMKGEIPDTSRIKLYVDFNQKQNGGNKLKVFAKDLAPQLKITKISPETVEYIIRK